MFLKFMVRKRTFRQLRITEMPGCLGSAHSVAGVLSSSIGRLRSGVTSVSVSISVFLAFSFLRTSAEIFGTCSEEAAQPPTLDHDPRLEHMCRVCKVSGPARCDVVNSVGCDLRSPRAPAPHYGRSALLGAQQQKPVRSPGPACSWGAIHAITKTFSRASSLGRGSEPKINSLTSITLQAYCTSVRFTKSA